MYAAQRVRPRALATPAAWPEDSGTMRCALIMATGLLAVGAAVAQSPPDAAESSADLLEITKTAIAAGGERDADALASLRGAAAALEAAPPPSGAEAKKLARTAGALLNRGRPLPPERYPLYEGVAEVLAQLGKDGLAQLRRAYDGKRLPTRGEAVEVRCALLRAIGRTRQPAAVDVLLKAASRAIEPALQAAAGEALAEFAGAAEAVRKDIVKRLVLELAGAEGQTVMGRPGEPVNLTADMAQRRLDAIKKPWLATLTRLTGVEHATGVAWQSWWNDHKSASWPQPEKSETSPFRPAGTKARGD